MRKMADAGSPEHWMTVLRAAMSQDAEFTQYIRRRSPRTANEAGDVWRDYIALLERRIEMTRRKLRIGDAVLTLADRHGFGSLGEFLEAAHRGDVDVSDETWESLIETGIVPHKGGAW
jgi:hypothetical protein